MNASDVVSNDIKYILFNAIDEFEKIKGKRILITGGAGFLGFYIVQTIVYWNTINVKYPIECHIYDNFIRGYPAWLRGVSDGKYIFITNHNIINELPDDIQDFDYIVHAASIASPTYYRLNPIETMNANVEGLRNLLNYSVKQQANGKPIQGFLNFSTSEIYGDPGPDDIPTSEEYRGNVSCTGPRACYDESKRFGETLIVNYFRKFNIPVKNVRPFNNYGPGLKITDGRALSDFARDVLLQRDIILLSDGSPTRTFCYVADAVVGYFKALTIGRAGDSYNIGVNRPEISILQLASLVADISKNLFGYNGKIKHQKSSDLEYLTDNPNRRCPIIEKARLNLGFNPTIPIEEGIRRSMIWYFENATAEDS
jgi:nucleoside-diphosphate-sugar epimerase